MFILSLWGALNLANCQDFHMVVLGVICPYLVILPVMKKFYTVVVECNKIFTNKFFTGNCLISINFKVGSPLLIN